jgi:hypothetical protein
MRESSIVISAEYESILYQIPISFGMNSDDSNELVNQMYLKAGRKYSVVYQDRLELTKRIVHQCVFKISCKIFSQEQQLAGFEYENINPYSNKISRLLKIPLSFSVVYILYHVIGFNETEVAYILNIDSIQVKERLGSAMRRMAVN